MPPEIGKNSTYQSLSDLACIGVRFCLGFRVRVGSPDSGHETVFGPLTLGDDLK